MEVTDPVCDRRIALETVAAHAEFNGWSYFFCSDRCAERFRQNPDAFVERRTSGPPSVKAER